MTNSSANFLSPEPNGQGLYFSELKYHGEHTYNFQNLTLQCNTLMIFLNVAEWHACVSMFCTIKLETPKPT